MGCTIFALVYLLLFLLIRIASAPPHRRITARRPSWRTNLQNNVGVRSRKWTSLNYLPVWLSLSANLQNNVGVRSREWASLNYLPVWLSLSGNADRRYPEASK